jgi:hypothetical protein
VDAEAADDLGTKLMRVQRLRRMAVIVGLVLLVVSLMNPTTAIAFARSILWSLCGCMCLVEMSLAKRAITSGVTVDSSVRPATLTKALLCFAVGLLPLLSSHYR